MLAPPQRLLRRHRLHGAERGRCRCCGAAPTAAAEPGEQQLPEICCSSLCSPCTRRGRRNGATTAAAEVRPCGTLQAIVEDRHRCAAPQRRCGTPLGGSRCGAATARSQHTGKLGWGWPGSSLEARSQGWAAKARSLASIKTIRVGDDAVSSLRERELRLEGETFSTPPLPPSLMPHTGNG